MLQQIAQGGANQLGNLAQFDGDYLEGQAGELLIKIRQVRFIPDLPAGFVTALQLALDRAPNLDVGRITYDDANILRIPFRRTFPPLVLIVAILAIFFVGAILLMVTGWALFREPLENLANSAADVGQAVAKNAKPLIIGAIVLGVLYMVTGGGKRKLF